MSEFPEAGAEEGCKEAKGDRGGLGEGTTVNGLGNVGSRRRRVTRLQEVVRRGRDE